MSGLAQFELVSKVDLANICPPLTRGRLLYSPRFTESYKVLQVLQREKKVTRSVGRQSTIPFLLLLFFFSSYVFSPLIRFLLLFFFSLFFSSPLTSLHLIVLNMFLLSSFKLRVSHCLLCLVSFWCVNHYKLPWLTTERGIRTEGGKWLFSAVKANMMEQSQGSVHQPVSPGSWQRLALRPP